MSDFDSLNTWQQQIFLRYQDIMGRGDFQMMLRVLEEADWDLQQAISSQFGGNEVSNAPVNPENVPMIPLEEDEEVATPPPEPTYNALDQHLNRSSFNWFPENNDLMVCQFQRRHFDMSEDINLPELFIGNLSEAIHDAFTKRKRPLLFYIENQNSENCERFARDILSNSLISNFINNRYVLFVWDATSLRAKEKLLSELEASYMTSARVKLENILDCTHALPVLLAVSHHNNTTTILEYCESSDPVDQVLEKLMTGADLYDRMEQIRANARQERESVRSEQEDEYRAALEEDTRRREEQLRREQEEQRQLEEARAREIEEAQRQENLKKTIPDEPEQNDDTVVTVRFKFPNQSEKTRRFRKTESIQTLVDFLSSDGWSSEQYNFINSERKNICSTFELDKTFEQAVEDKKWTPRESINVAKKPEDQGASVL